MRRLSTTIGLLAAASVTCVPAASANHNTNARTAFPDATTNLLSRSAAGGVPNGPSRNASISHDQRFNRVIAFESDASDLVAGDGNGLTDVFIVRRADPIGPLGDPWVPGPTSLVSTGMGGAPANGRSYGPSVDGASHTAPSCVAFVSDASSLVPGDTNGVADAFVRHLATGAIERVSLGSGGEQANGPTSEVSVSGDCRRVAFTAAATNLALHRTSDPRRKPSATGRTRAGIRQVYVRVLVGTGKDKAFSKMTFLASASAARRAANGESFDSTIALDGKSVAFTSRGSNVVPGDHNGTTDVFPQRFPHKFAHFGPRSKVKSGQTLLHENVLVSTAAGSEGSAGGASQHPAITDSARYVAFETLASNVIPNDGNGASDIAFRDLKAATPSYRSVSEGLSGVGNAASHRPAITDAADFVVFDSEASNFKVASFFEDDPNGVSDMMVWTGRRKVASVESLDSVNDFVAGPSSNAVVSARGNYVLFESADARLDRAIPNGVMSSIYLRYLGACDTRCTR